MRFRGAFSLILVIIMLSGCNQGSTSELTMNDLSIEKIGESKSRVEYGMSRSDAEKVLGTVQDREGAFFYYENGITIMYRDEENQEVVAAIVLDGDTDESYQTPKIKIGMLKEDIKKVYGLGNTLNDAEKNLDFAFDTKAGSYLTQESKRKESAEEMEDVWMVSVTFDDNGYADRIMLLDQRMAMYLD